MINNNSLSTYEMIPPYGHELDLFFRNQLTLVDNRIKVLKNDYPDMANHIVELTNLIDSEQFCTHIIGEIVTSSDKLLTNVDTSPLKDSTLKKIYSIYHATVVNSLKAARIGDIESLTYLHDRGIDLSGGDYDR